MLIWIWILALGLVLYLVPVIMHRVAKEGFESPTSSSNEDTSSIVGKMEHVPLYLMKDPETLGKYTFALKSEPAPLNMIDAGIETPAMLQGQLARRTVSAPVYEGFYQTKSSSPSGSPSGSPSPGVMTETTKCGLVYNPAGDHIYTCSSTTSSGTVKQNFLPEMPEWLTAMATKDMYSAADLEMMKYWLSTQKLSADPTEFLIAAKNLKTTGSTTKTASTASTSSTSSTSSSTECKPKCEPVKPKCKEPEKPKCPKCPECPSPKDYIHKDSIPCWACKI